AAGSVWCLYRHPQAVAAGGDAASAGRALGTGAVFVAAFAPAALRAGGGKDGKHAGPATALEPGVGGGDAYAGIAAGAGWLGVEQLRRYCLPGFPHLQRTVVA